MVLTARASRALRRHVEEAGGESSSELRLWRAALKLLRGSPGLRVFLTASLITSLGSALTRVVVYGKLAAFGAPPLLFGWAYALSIIPGLFAAGLGMKALTRFGVRTTLMGSEILGMAGVTVPWMGVMNHSAPLLVVSMLLPGIASGLAVGSYAAAIKRLVPTSGYGVFAALDSLSFTGSSVIGTGLAALAYGLVPIQWYFLGDAVSYAVALAGFWYLGTVPSSRIAGPSAAAEPVANRMVLGTMPRLRGTRLRAFMLLPLMAATNGAAMALLPALGTHFRAIGREVTITLDPTVLLVFARTVGQAAGSLAFRPARIQALFMSSRALVMLVAMYIGLYALAFGLQPSTRIFFVVLLIVVLAHVASNVVYVAANTATFDHFTERETPIVSTRASQLTTAILAIVSIAAGGLAKDTSLLTAMLTLSIPAFVVYVTVVLTSGRPVRTGLDGI